MAQRTVPDWRQAVDPLRASSPRAAARQAIVNPALPQIRQGQFVRRLGNTLMLGDRPFRFNGNNTYYLQAEIAYGREAGVEETLDKMADRKRNIRMVLKLTNNRHDSPVGQRLRAHHPGAPEHSHGSSYKNETMQVCWQEHT